MGKKQRTSLFKKTFVIVATAIVLAFTVLACVITNNTKQSGLNCSFFCGENLDCRATLAMTQESSGDIFDEISISSKNTSGDNQDAEDDLKGSIDDILNEVDLSEIEQFLNSLTPEQKKAFGAESALDFIKKIVSGDAAISYSNIFSYIFSVFGSSVVDFLPFVASILVICIAFTIINSIKGKFASDSVESIVHFVCFALVIIIVLFRIATIITETVKAVTLLQKQMNVIFPILLTMMAATGAVSSVAVYQPAVAIMAGGVAEIIASVVLPLFIITVAFTAVGNVSKGVKLKKIADFFASASKWLFGTIFFVFITFLSVQGITASVYDGVSVRTAKFAISKYVPVIGGYLSEGFNLIMAGSVLVKNAVGMTAVVLLFVSVAPLVIEILLLGLSLHLAGAIAEPLGNSEISGFLTSLAKSINTLIAVVLGTVFLYFIFIVLVISTGNLSI